MFVKLKLWTEYVRRLMRRALVMRTVSGMAHYAKVGLVHMLRTLFNLKTVTSLR